MKDWKASFSKRKLSQVELKEVTLFEKNRETLAILNLDQLLSKLLWMLFFLYRRGVFSRVASFFGKPDHARRMFVIRSMDRFSREDRSREGLLHVGLLWFVYSDRPRCDANPPIVAGQRQAPNSDPRLIVVGSRSPIMVHEIPVRPTTTIQYHFSTYTTIYSLLILV